METNTQPEPYNPSIYPGKNNLGDFYNHILSRSEFSFDDTLHDILLELDRELYAALLIVPDFPDKYKLALILRLLAITDTAGLGERQKEREDRLINRALQGMGERQMLEGLMPLFRLKVNNRRTTRFILKFILGRENLEFLGVNYRRQVGCLLRHALGEKTVSHILRLLTRPENWNGGERVYLRRNLFRFASDEHTEEKVGEFFRFVFGKLTEPVSPLFEAYLGARKNIQAGQGLPLRVLKGLSATYRPRGRGQMLKKMAGRTKQKREVNPEKVLGGEETLIGSARRFYLSGQTEGETELMSTLDRELSSLGVLPVSGERVVVIADNSASMVGFGNRQFNNLAMTALLAEALRKLVGANVLWTPGAPGEGEIFPPAGGPADPARVLPAAYELKPDKIIFIGDGYEEIGARDLEDLHRALERLGLNVPSAHIMPVFTDREGEYGRSLPGADLIRETFSSGLRGAFLRVQFKLAPKQCVRLMRETALMLSTSGSSRN